MELDVTKIQLIICAEKVFAEKGLGDVSLKEIIRASGQKNSSVLHYHFGTREGLIKAILEYRMAATDRRRREMLDTLEAEGRTDDLRALVAVKSWPLAEHLIPGEEENNYLRFIAQIHTSPKFDFRDIVNQEHDSVFRQINNYILKILDHLPEQTVRRRLRILPAQQAIAYSEVKRMMLRAKESGSRFDFDLELAMETILDMQVGALSAPVSEKAAALEVKHHKQKLPSPDFI